jgi:DNA polymerase-3 subunit delta'
VFSRVASLGHADLIVLERGFDPDRKRQRSEIVIDDVRKLNAFYSMTAAEGGWRIAVVDAADEMNRNAANALLKVLEEPPPKCLLILVAHRADLLLPTIRSRCRRVRMQPLSDADTGRVIARFLPDLDPQDRAILTRLAEGSPGRALRLAQAGGIELYGEFIARLGQAPAVDTPRLHSFADRVAQGDGESFRAFTDLVNWWLSRMIRTAGMGLQLEVAIEGEAAVIQHMLARRGLDQWVGVWENLSQLFDCAGPLALDRKQVVLNAFFALDHSGDGTP